MPLFRGTFLACQKMLLLFRKLLEIRGTPFKTFTFLAFSDVFYLPLLEEGLHLNFSPATAKKFLRRAGRTGVLTSLSHVISPCHPAIFPAGIRRFMYTI
jgi:hypothetical protein